MSIPDAGALAELLRSPDAPPVVLATGADGEAVYVKLNDAGELVAADPREDRGDAG